MFVRSSKVICINSRRSRSGLRYSATSSSSRRAPGREQEVKSFSDIPGPRPSFPLIGTSWQYFKFFGRYELFKLHEANLDKYHRFGPIAVEEFEWRKPVVHLFDPNDFEKVFRGQGKCPHRPPNEFVCHFRRKNSSRYPSVGLAHLLGEEWYRQRQLLAPAFLKLGVIQNHIPAQNQICQDFVEYLLLARDPSTGIVADLQEAAYRFALESICMVCLESRMGCLSSKQVTSDGDALITATKRLFDAYQELYYGLPFWKMWPTKSYRKFTESETNIYDTASKYIEMAVTRLSDAGERTGGNSSSILETLLKTEGIDERDIRIMVLDFIAGGIFTVSNSLSLLFYHLANNPHVQEKLYQEVSSLVHQKDGEITSEHLSKMTYLKACAKESFRLTSTVPSIVRVLPQPITLSGYEVPAGTTVFCHFLVTCQLLQYFEEPTLFSPERWLGRSRQKIHPFALLPFGFGNRMCAGRRFSELELYLAAAKTVLNFRLEAVTSQVDLTHAFIVIPAHSIQVALVQR